MKAEFRTADSTDFTDAVPERRRRAVALASLPMGHRLEADATSRPRFFGARDFFSVS
jgi:hypothetical protein